jgi:branched-chain amino acid transport system substrate-binding protein
MKKELGRLVKFGLKFFIMLTLTATIFTVNGRSIAEEKVIYIGQVTDLTGPGTSFAGKPFSYGVRDYFDLVNRRGGISGRMLKVLSTDGGYIIPRETAAFKEFSMENIVAFIDWSTGGALQISPMCAEKKIVNFGGALLETLADPVKYPYRFIHTATYEHCWLAMIHYQIKNHPGKKKTAGLTYPDNPFGRMNADAIRAHLKKVNIPLVDEEVIDDKTLDATSQMLKMKRANPDFILNVQTQPAISCIMRDARKVGINAEKTQFYAPLNALGYELPKLGGENVRHLLLGVPFSDISEAGLPGIKQIIQYSVGKALNPDAWYISGWVAASVISEGLRIVMEKGEVVSGENLKKALEGLKNFDNGGITAPITYTPSKHVGTYGIKIYRPNLNKMTGVERVSDWFYPE